MLVFKLINPKEMTEEGKVLAAADHQVWELEEGKGFVTGNVFLGRGE